MYSGMDDNPEKNRTENSAVPGDGENKETAGKQDGEYRYVRPGQDYRLYEDASYSPKDETNIPPRYYTPSVKPVKVKKARRPRGGITFARLASMCLICAILGGLIGGAATFEYLDSIRGGEAVTEPPIPGGGDTGVQTPAITPPSTTKSTLTGEEVTAAAIYETACTQVVGITTEITTANIFGMMTSGSVTGSGFILSDDGYILTNYHVIAEASAGGYDVTVVFYDGTKYTAEIIGYESDNDIAILKIDASGLAAVSIGNSDLMKVGEKVYTVGNPLGELNYTMTSGIVSARDRIITTSEGVAVNMFQIDAAVNAGNSGGPVYDSTGEVIGVVTAKYSSAGVEGLGFAVPINDAVDIANELISNGYVTGKAMLGIAGQTVSSREAQYYNMAEGVYIYNITPGSAAEKAGLRLGDIITAIDDNKTLSLEDMKVIVRSYRAGDSANLTVYRSGEYITVPVVFDEALPQTPAAEAQVPASSNRGYTFYW